MSFKIKFIQLEGQKYRNKFYSAFFKEKPTRNFGFQLTLFQLGGGADYAYTITTYLPTRIWKTNDISADILSAEY